MAREVAYSNNLDLRLLAAEIVVQEDEVAVMKAGRAPTVSVQNITTINNNGQTRNRVGLGLEIDVFSTDRRTAIARSAGLNKALAADLDNLKEDLSFYIERLLSDAAAANQLARGKQTSVQALTARVQALERQMDQGLATFSDLIDARSDLYQVQYEALELQNEAQMLQADVLLKTGVFAF